MLFRRSNIILLICLFIESFCFGQELNQKFNHISLNQGLSSSEVNCIIQDHRGFMWFGTQYGLNRYDGYTIKSFYNDQENTNSLSDNYILSLFEDSKGNLWVGTNSGGLNRFNREKEEFEKFINNTLLEGSVSGSAVTCIYETKSGDLLIGTNLGLDLLLTDNHSDSISFRRLLNIPVNSIAEDAYGNLLVATWEGVFKLESSGKPSNYKNIIRYAPEPGNSEGFLLNESQTIYVDKDGIVWVGTTKGLLKLETKDITPQKIEIKHYQSNENDLNSLSNNIVTSICEDHNGNLWIGTRGGGINLLDKRSEKFVQIKSDIKDPTIISNNSVKNLYIDHTGILWVGTLGGGVNNTNLKQKKFFHHKINLKDNSELVPNNFIREIHQDESGLLWIGTLNDGLYTLDRKNNNYSVFNAANKNSRKAGDNSALKGDNVFSIINSSESEFYFASNSGLYFFNKKSGELVNHRADNNNPNTLIHNSVFTIAKDGDNFWVGTWMGLQKFIPENSDRESYFISYSHNPADSTSISSDKIRYIYDDPMNKDLWVGTLDGGVNRLIKNESDSSISFERFMFEEGNPNSLSDNYVTMIHRSKNNILWVATKNGLNKLIREENNYKFKKYFKQDGLPGNLIQSILEDDHGNLWLGTNNGLSKFDPTKEVFTNFDVTDGLQSNEFSEHSCFKNKDGEMFFGGINGFNSFYPDSIYKNQYKPKMAITDFQIFNKSIPIGETKDGRVLLSKSISETNELVLSYKDKVITFEFTALSYASPEKNKYAYMLEGFDNDWLYSNSRKATYTNLKGGKFTFKVKASNNDGIWNENPISLKVNVKHPFWQTWIAYIIYLIVISLTVYAIFKDIKSRERLKADLELKKLEKEKSKELEKMRLQFFTNITHEFRNPLTLIISPLQKLIESKKVNTQLKKDYQLMYRNADYLISLINELIEFRKVETGGMKLQASENNLINFLQNCFSIYEDVAAKREISYRFETPFSELNLWFDKNKLYKAITNLLSNAFKFVPDKGEIILKVEQGNEENNQVFKYRYEVKDQGNILKNAVLIRVIDNGIGISSKSISNIFNRFYQEPSDSTKHLGSGIGLAFTKNLVLLHKGEIEVQSERNAGTQFTIKLPSGNEHLNESEKVKVQETQDNIIAEDFNDFPQNNDIFQVEESYIKLPEPEQKSAPIILVVEDNNDMRSFIKENLELKYNVIEAENGKIGLEKAFEHVPDLVVSDVMMPEMDGIQLCSKLKRDIKTSHIPVILLTARSSIIHQIEGIETGADDYISKPFNLKLFETRIDNLIKSRRKLRQLFSNEVEVKPKDITFNHRDQEFLDKAIAVITKQISKQDLNVESLSKDLNMSRMHLHRKLTALTNQTPSVFIRTIRLKEGAKFLGENKLSISEIAYAVGFSAPSYFTSCFSNQFGISPKDYMAKFK